MRGREEEGEHVGVLDLFVWCFFLCVRGQQEVCVRERHLFCWFQHKMNTKKQESIVYFSAVRRLCTLTTENR